MNEHVQAAASEPLFNPLSPDFIRDPYPHYQRLRSTDPMHVNAHGAFVASRHAEVSLVLRRDSPLGVLHPTPPARDVVSIPPSRDHRAG